MNKFIRFSLVLILIVIAFVLVLAFVEPNDVTVSRSVVIRAAKEPVFEQIVKFTNWNNWYILHERDTTVKITCTGSGEQGSTYHWAGDEHLTGEGEIRNEGIDSSTMHYTFMLTRPGEMKGDGIISAIDTAGLTKVTWTFHKHFTFPGNAVLIVFNLDKYIGGDFDAALGNLKKYVEKTTVYKPPVAIMETTFPARLYAGIKQTVSFTDIAQFFSNTFNKLNNELTKRINGNAFGVYYSWDTITHTVEIMAAYPVADSSVTLKNAIYMWLPSSQAYMVVYKGPYSGIGAAYEVMDKYIAKKGKTSALKVEEYSLGPMQEPDSTKWITNIYYLVSS